MRINIEALKSEDFVSYDELQKFILKVGDNGDVFIFKIDGERRDNKCTVMVISPSANKKD